MQVTALSDAHADVIGLTIPSTDVLVYAGDWSNGGSMAETAKFIYWLCRQPAKHKIVVPGNHDRFCEEAPKLAQEMFRDNGIYYLKDEAIEIEGKRFYGTPWCPMFMNWAFMRNEEWMAEAFKLIPFNLDCLICHTPPKGILDEVDGKNIGSKALYDRLLHITPKNVVFGHLHKKGYASITTNKKTINLYNVSVCNEDYEIVNTPTVINI